MGFVSVLLIMAGIFLSVLIVLIVILVSVIIKYGIVYTQPQFVWVVLNVITGKLGEKFPGLSIIIPGVHKKIREVNCSPHVMGIQTISVVSSDGQPFNVSYQLTWRVDAFSDEEKKKHGETGKEDDTMNWKKVFSMMLKGDFQEFYRIITGREKRFKEGRAIKAAIRISNEKKDKDETDEQALERHASANVQLETKATVTSILGGHETDELKKQEKCKIYCPICHQEIGGDAKKCTGKVIVEGVEKNCRWAEDDASIPIDFKERLSWLTTVRLDKSLSDRFGIGCDIKISNITPPEDLQKALLDQKVFEIKKDIAQKQGEAVQRRLEAEALGYEHLNAKGINPNIAFLGEKAMSVIPGLLELMTSKPAKKNIREKESLQQEGDDNK